MKKSLQSKIFLLFFIILIAAGCLLIFLKKGKSTEKKYLKQEPKKAAQVPLSVFKNYIFNGDFIQKETRKADDLKRPELIEKLSLNWEFIGLTETSKQPQFNVIDDKKFTYIKNSSLHLSAVTKDTGIK